MANAKKCNGFSQISQECQDVCVFVFDFSQVVLAADMLGQEGLKDVAEMVLTRDYCRFFPKVRERMGSRHHIQSNRGEECK